MTNFPRMTGGAGHKGGSEIIITWDRIGEISKLTAHEYTGSTT